MLSTKIRTAITVIGAAAALALSATGIASGAVPVKDSGDTPQMTTTRTPTSPRAGRPLPTNPRPVVPVGDVNVAKDGGSTGDGPADDEECEGYARVINMHLDLAEGSLDTGNVAGYITERAAATAAEEEGSDRGCFFIDEEADMD
jgi:hypothetical protein